MINPELIKSSKKFFDLDLPTTNASFKKAYRMACLKFHPDKGGDEEIFKELQQIYEELIKNAAYVFTDEEFKALNPTTREGIPLHELGLGLGFTVNGTDCPVCNHRGYLIEYGYHYKVCDYCNNGRVNAEFKCKACNGTGKFTQRRGKVVDCYKCQGSGIFKHPLKTMWCPKCRGTMTVHETDEQQVYYTKCYHCNGTGELPMFNPVLPKGLLR